MWTITFSGSIWCHLRFRNHTWPLTLQSSCNSILHSSVFFFQTLTTILMAMREILQRTGSLRMAQRPCHSLTSRPPCLLTSAHKDRTERPSHPHHQKGCCLGYDCVFKCLCVCFELEEKVIKQLTCCRYTLKNKGASQCHRRTFFV